MGQRLPGDGTQPAQDTQTELPHTGFGIGLLAIIAAGTTLVGMTLISWRQRTRDDRWCRLAGTSGDGRRD